MRTAFLIVALLMASSILAQSHKEDPPLTIACNVGRIPLLKQVKPQYPEDAKRKGVGGDVLIRVVIDETGKPISMKLVKGHPSFAKAALAVLPEWRWKPYIFDGHAVRVEGTVTIHFVPKPSKGGRDSSLRSE